MKRPKTARPKASAETSPSALGADDSAMSAALAEPEGVFSGDSVDEEEDVAEHIAPPWGGMFGGPPLSLDGEPEATTDGQETNWPLVGERLTSVLESLLFAADKPLSVERIHELLEETAAAPHKPSGPPLYKPQTILAALEQLTQTLEQTGRGIGLLEVAGGWQLRTAAANAPWVQRLLKQKPVRLSRAQLEALSIVAYRQPITRPEIDDIRGVDSGGSLRTLLDRNLIRILGKKEEPGRPLLYGTTKEFLEFFNLKDLKDLPTLREYYDLTEESRDKVRAAGFDPPLPSEVPPGPAQGSLPVDGVLAPPTIEAPQVTGEGEAPTKAADTQVATTPVAKAVELIDQQLADDAENLAKIDEMIRAVNTAFPLLDPTLFGDPAEAATVPGGTPSPAGSAPSAAVSHGTADLAIDDEALDAEPDDQPKDGPTDGPTERDENE